MFGVGLHFSIKDLWSVRKIAIPGALAQIIVATALGAILGRFWGWSWGAGIVFGLCLSVASTVVLLRALKERDLVETVNGRIAVGWLIVEDLVTVIALVALPALATTLGGEAPTGQTGSVAMTLVITLAKVSVFVAAMLIFGKQIIPRLLGRVARTGNRELFTLGVVAVALGVAFGASALFGVSPALGAFFAGVIISESDLSHQAGAEMLPLQEIFTVLFFVSIGMMFDPRVLVQHPLHVLLTLIVVMVGKSIITAAIVLVFRYPVGTSLRISAGLAQIGEFSFILLSVGISLKIVPTQALSIVLAAAILSIALNPWIFSTIDPIEAFLKKRPRFLALLERPQTEQPEINFDQEGLTDHVVMIGFGRVGGTVARAMEQESIRYVVVDQDRVIIDELNKRGVPTVFGDAARPGILDHAGLARARLLLVATPAKSHAREIIEYAHQVNPDIVICVRTHTYADVKYFEELGIQRIVMGELELALEMAHHTLLSYGRDEEHTEDLLEVLRDEGLHAPTVLSSATAREDSPTPPG